MFPIFKELTFSEFKFLIDTPILDTRYKHFGSQNNYLYYSFIDKFDYALADYFAKLKITKCNIDKFLSNPLIKPIIKKFSYCNANKWIKKSSIIL